MNNIIYKFDVAKLYNLGDKDRDRRIIKCSKILKDVYEEIDTNNDNLLFDQIRKELGNKVSLKEVIVIMDFAKFADNISSLQNFDNGFELEDKNGNKSVFKLFVKSNSMSRSFQCYYINEKYEERIMKRISFDLINPNSVVSISKWAAYLGLTCSSAEICNDIHLKQSEVAIVEDKECVQKATCLTAISISYLLTLLDDIKKYYNDKTHLKEIDDELNCYFASSDYASLEEDEDGQKVKVLLNELKELLQLSGKDIVNRANDLVSKYNAFTQSNKKDVWHQFHVKDFAIKLNLFDGVGLINKELQGQICRSLGLSDDNTSSIYSNNNYSFQIRLPFIKGMVHTCDLQKFFRKHKVTKIKSIKNFTSEDRYEYKDASKIKMIITVSQFKGSKYLQELNKIPSQVAYYFETLRKYNYPLAIANIETREDKRGRFNYQFLTTLPLDDRDVGKLIEKSIEEIKRRGEKESIKNSIIFNNDEDNADCYMIKNYETYYLATKRYDDKRKENMEAEVRDCLQGKIRCDSSRRYLAPDLLELLYYVIGKDVPEDQVLSINSFYAPFTYNELDQKANGMNFDNEINLILRNPHYSRNEIVISTRDTCIGKERDEYFDKLYGVLMINPLSFSADRLGGADYDGDSVLMVYDSEFTTNMKLRLLDKHGNYIHPFAKIPSLVEKPVKPNYGNKIKSLASTFSNETGLISNYAFKKAVLQKDNPNIHDELAFLTILSGLEIDSAKTGKKPYLPITATKKNVFLKMKEAIKTNSESSEYYYTNSKLKKAIKEILKDEENKDEKSKDEKNNNYHLLYRIIDAILNYKLPKNDLYNRVKPLKLLGIPKKYNKNNGLKIKGIISAYNKLIFKNQEVKKARDIRISNLGIIKDKLNDIIAGRYPVDAFLDAFKTPLGKTTLSKYTKAIKEGNPYHFMMNKEDKINFIKDVLGLDINDEILDIVTDFSNEGYQLLYLSLLYYKESDELNVTMDLDKLKVNKDIEKLSDEDKKVALVARDYVINKIIATHPLGQWDYQELIDEITRIASEDFEEISFVDVANTIDLIKDSYQFEIFAPKMIAYFKKQGKENDDDDEYSEYEDYDLYA